MYAIRSYYEEQVVPDPDGLESGQRQQVLDVGRRQPALVRLRPFHPEALAAPEDRLPQIVVIGDDDS